ncbi:MAG: type II toxin-antitoxin system RelE/ParE family toxin [Fimbriimonas sp.]
MPSRIFTIPAFDKFAKKQAIRDDRLIDAVDRADRGLVYADLGEGVIKQTVGRPNESPVKGYRTIIGFVSNTRAFFFFGFAKNEADNITDRALQDFRQRAALLHGLEDLVIDILVTNGELREVDRPERTEEDGEER